MSALRLERRMTPTTTTTTTPEKAVPYSEETVSAREREFSGSVSGWIVLGALFAAVIAAVAYFVSRPPTALLPVAIGFSVVAFIFVMKGFFVVNPNEAFVVQLAG